jgi:hypothetical protein
MEQSIYWEANLFSATQEFPAFYETQKFIAAFTIAPHLSLSCVRSIHPWPHLPSRKSNFILYFHLRLGLSSVRFPSGPQVADEKTASNLGVFVNILNK